MNFFKLSFAKTFAHLRSVLVGTDSIFNNSNNTCGKIFTSSKTLFIFCKRNIYTKASFKYMKIQWSEQHTDFFDKKNWNCKDFFFCSYTGRCPSFIPVADHFQGIPPRADHYLDQWMNILSFSHYEYCICILTFDLQAQHSTERHQADAPLSLM